MVPARFKDFISTPKTNGYRSIHTTVIGPEKQRVEVQIRTQEMHDIAERGVAAHWRYREHIGVKDRGEANALEWLRDMVELLERGDSAEDFLENSRLNMYHQDQGLLLHRRRAIFDLAAARRDADRFRLFADAYRSRQSLRRRRDQRQAGAAAYAAAQRRPGRDHPHQGADAVAALGAVRRHRPSARRGSAAASCAMPSATSTIALRPQDPRQGVRRRAGFELTEKAIAGVAKKLHLSKAEDVYAEVGRGALRGHEVLEAVFPELKLDPERRKHAAFVEPGVKRMPISLRGSKEGISYHLGQCCHPLPGDRIVGPARAGRGHRHSHRRLRGAGARRD